MSDKQIRGCVTAIIAEFMWVVLLALDVFVFARLTQWVWEYTVSVWLQVPRLTFVEAFIVTLLSSIINFLLIENIRRQSAED